jgi:hypothetical protein
MPVLNLAGKNGMLIVYGSNLVHCNVFMNGGDGS